MTNKRFRDALRINMADFEKAETKDAMATLMRIAGYRRECFDKKTGRKVKWKAGLPVRNIDPSQKQLDYAWKYFKGGQQFIDKEEFWKVYTVMNKRTKKEMIIRKAVKDVYIRGKLYKKGWFIPKKVRE